MAGEKKGITVKIDADLHAEVRQYLEQHGMTMVEFVTLALDDELHPKHQQKEEQKMGNMRTLAFQVPEELFQKLKGYLARNNMTQKEFVIGLIETELEREQTELEAMAQDKNGEAMDQDEAALSDTSNQFTDEAAPEFGGELQDEDDPEESQDLVDSDYTEEFEDETTVDISDDIQDMESGENSGGFETVDKDTVLGDDLEGTEDEEMDETVADIPEESQDEDIEDDMDYEAEEETEHQGFSMGM